VDDFKEKRGMGKEELSRRRFLNVVGWGSMATLLAGIGGAAAKYFYPGVLYEPRSTFNAGKPADYLAPQGEEKAVVDERWKKSQRVWIVRNKTGIYGLIGVCTHLGCTPNWFQSEHLFKCPCHGSVYNPDGEPIAGPAPEPLYRPKIHLDPAGNMIVSTGLLGIRRPNLETTKKYKDVYWHDDEKAVILKPPFFLAEKA
jgi:cytochrome b6-f complex iron-sulfur subunit